VIGGDHRQFGVRIEVGHERGGQAHGVGRVPGDRLQDQPVGAQLG
jgi:hypothetical protein